MHKDESVIFQFDPEIEWTIRRLRREQRNSRTVSDMNNLQVEGNLSLNGPLQPANIKKSIINMLTGDSQATTILFTWLMTKTNLYEIMPC